MPAQFSLQVDQKFTKTKPPSTITIPAQFPPHVGQNFTKTVHDDIYTATNPLLSDLSQPSKTVLITGASRSIGRSVALRFAEASVSRIVLLSRSSSTAVAAEIAAIDSSIKVLQIAADISNMSDVERAGREFAAWDGEKSIVPLCESKPDEWWKTWEVSIRGTFLMLHTFLPFVIATAEKTGQPGTIVNTSSIGAHLVVPGMSSYQPSRFAILRLSEFVDAEYGSKGVNVHSLHPGGVVTDMTRSMGATKNEGFPDTPELAAGFLVWLTHKNRSWLNGRYLNVEWDVEELESMRAEIVEGDKLKMRMVI